MAFLVLILSSLSLNWPEKDFLWILWGLALGIGNINSGFTLIESKTEK